MNKLISFIVFLVIVLMVIAINKPSGHNQELERKELIYKHKLDSIEKVLTDSIHKRELFYLAEYQKAVTKLDKMEGEAKHWRRKYDTEVKNRRSFSDATIDSLLRAVD